MTLNPPNGATDVPRLRSGLDPFFADCNAQSISELARPASCDGSASAFCRGDRVNLETDFLS
jgi:hypothetical protein